MQRLKSEHIPKATIERLAVYLQVLGTLRREGLEVVSSEKLARSCKVNPSQIRKDLAYFGEFGVRGVGYYVKELISSIKESLGINRVWNCALIGVGNMGRALLGHKEFKHRRFNIAAIFDCDIDKIGTVVSGMEVVCTQRMKEKVDTFSLEIGIITTPPERAQRACDYCIAAGIKGIINFAPAQITTPDHIHVEYVDFFHHLYALAFHITLAEEHGEA